MIIILAYLLYHIILQITSVFLFKFQFIGQFCGMDKSIPYNAIQNIIVGQGLAPAEKIRENTAGASPYPTSLFEISISIE